MLKTPKHILVIRLSAMGDVAMTIPVIKAFTQQHPEVKLTVLTRSFFKPIFRNIPNVKVHIADVKGDHKSISGLFKLSNELKKLEIEAVADLHNVLRSNMLKLFLRGVPFYQIDKGRREKHALTTGKIFKQLKTTHVRYADVFEKMGFKIDLSKPIFPESNNFDEVTSSVIGNNSKPMIGIAPFAAFKGKEYPLSLMEQVVKELSKDFQVILFGGRGKEKEKLERLASKKENVINLSGKLNLNQELDVISNLKIMIAMDSGNAHLAAMLGIKVLTIWGVTHPYAGFYPFNQPNSNSLLSDRERFPLIPTSVYGNKYPEGYEKAIQTISPEFIIKKVKEII